MASEQRVRELVMRYATRVRGAVAAQHVGESVSSPLGIWLVLSAALLGAEGALRDQLEAVVGCSAEQAGELLDRVLSHGPPALAAAVALWSRGDVGSSAFAGWVEQLPEAVEVGLMPSQEHADAWARRNTLGLIPRFPAAVAGLAACLASAVAIDVSWETPFEVARSRDAFPAASGWSGVVSEVLRFEDPTHAGVVETRAAGVVAVFEAVAEQDLTVICISADPEVSRDAVLDAAQELTSHIQARGRIPGCSLFDVPLGDGHSWSLSERERPAWESGQRFERITDAFLPAWRLECSLDLLASDAFAAAPALQVLEARTGASGPRSARQTAVAAFDRYGFKAAAVTGMWHAISKPRDPTEVGVERVAQLRFDHPFAAIAVSGSPHADPGANWLGLPLFEAWITAPTEPEPERT